MANLQEVKDAIDAEGQQVTARLDELTAQISALQDQIANGAGITTEDLEDLKSRVQNIFTPPAPPA